MKHTTIQSRTEHFELDDKDIRQALSEYVQRKEKIEGKAEVDIFPDTSWENDGEGFFLATVQITVVSETPH